MCKGYIRFMNKKRLTIEEKPMIHGIRKSKYNYMVYDENGNLVIYN